MGKWTRHQAATNNKKSITAILAPLIIMSWLVCVNASDEDGQGSETKKNRLPAFLQDPGGKVEEKKSERHDKSASELAPVIGKKKKKQEKSGFTTGIIVAKEGSTVEIRKDGEDTARRYLPPWKGGKPEDGGGFDEDIVAKIEDIPAGNRIFFSWAQDEQLRLTDIQLLAPAEKSGIDKGKLAAKGDSFFIISIDNGTSEYYAFKDAKAGTGVAGKLADVEIGAKINVKWSYGERKNALDISFEPIPE